MDELVRRGEHIRVLDNLSTGRGALIIPTEKLPLPDQGYPIYWPREAQLKAADDVDAARMAGKHDLRKEIVVPVDHGKGGLSVYQVGREQFREVG